MHPRRLLKHLPLTWYRPGFVLAPPRHHLYSLLLAEPPLLHQATSAHRLSCRSLTHFSLSHNTLFSLPHSRRRRSTRSRSIYCPPSCHKNTLPSLRRKLAAAVSPARSTISPHLPFTPNCNTEQLRRTHEPTSSRVYAPTRIFGGGNRHPAGCEGRRSENRRARRRRRDFESRFTQFCLPM